MPILRDLTADEERKLNRVKGSRTARASVQPYIDALVTKFPFIQDTPAAYYGSQVAFVLEPGETREKAKRALYRAAEALKIGMTIRRNRGDVLYITLTEPKPAETSATDATAPETPATAEPTPNKRKQTKQVTSA